MPTEFKLPELGENITAGDVVRVLVSPGDSVAKDQPVLELETDKATIEVPSSVAGTVKELKVKTGERVKVGQVVLTVDDGDAAAAEKPAKEQPAKEQPAAKAEPAAKEDSGDAEGGLNQRAGQKPRGDGSERAAAERDAGRADQPETQKPEAPPAKPKRGEVVDISRGSRGAQPAAPAPPADAPAETRESQPPAAPSVRRLARELGVEISQVPGNGPGGRISIEDVQSYVRSAMSGGAAGGARVATGAPLPDFSKWGEVERKAMSNIRRKTAEHLSQAWNAIPHVTQNDKADITELERLRKQYSPQAEQAGGKLTMTAIALKIVAGALRKFPHFNVAVDMGAQEIVYKQAVHVGVAVDTERGLLVPVIRDADRKGIFELSAELAKASEKARAGKLTLDEMQGGSLTITNLGGIGGTSFTPIVNWPEVAILGISRGSMEPVWDGSQFQPRMMLPLSLSYDHRVIDGADAARFLRWVAEAFEQPFVLAL
jgi:pyruvate dehydrogenase E2 component (dihydrolipoyllysine-residue acetyltransferase)